MAYDNNMSGALFKNKDKEGKQPDYRGECEIDGKKYQIAGWMKQSQKGVPFMSLKFQEPRQEQKPAPRGSKQDDDDIIPF